MARKRKAIRWTDAELDAMTSPEALMAAQDEIVQAWRRDAPPEARDLIDAPESPPSAPPPSPPGVNARTKARTDDA